VPSSDRLDHFEGHPERNVDLPMDRFRGGRFADLEDLAVASGQNDGDHPMGAGLLAQGRPRGVNARTEESLLDGRHRWYANTQRKIWVCVRFSR